MVTVTIVGHGSPGRRMNMLYNFTGSGRVPSSPDHEGRFDSQVGAEALVQRFGSAQNLHFHMPFLDGV